jgi:dephospho-CoA kinase
MFVVGLTGGIGSGKTAASDRFAELGIKIIDADLAARTVVEPGSDALAEIAAHFGTAFLLLDGSLDRAALRRKIFTDADEKRWLENLLHPLIAQEISRGLQAANSPYAILVSPLLIEAGQDRFCNRILVIDVPEQLQLERTRQRDNNDEAQVRRIMASQASRQQRLDKADDVIENTAAPEQLLQQIDKLHHRYLEYAKKTNHG